MSGSGRTKVRKPTVRYDFALGNIRETLPREAGRALRARGLGTNRMEQELRNYYRYRGVDEVRPVRVLQIVSRYVTVVPASFTEMEVALGRKAAREYSPVGEYTWRVQDFLDYIDMRLGHQHRQDVNFMIENNADTQEFIDVSRRHLTRAGYTLTDLIRHGRTHGYGIAQRTAATTVTE